MCQQKRNRISQTKGEEEDGKLPQPDHRHAGHGAGRQADADDLRSAQGHHDEPIRRESHDRLSEEGAQGVHPVHRIYDQEHEHAPAAQDA